MKFQIALYYRSSLTRLNTLSLEDLGYYFALWAMLCQLGTENWIMIYLRDDQCRNVTTWAGNSLLEAFPTRQSQ